MALGGRFRYGMVLALVAALTAFSVLIATDGRPSRVVISVWLATILVIVVVTAQLTYKIRWIVAALAGLTAAGILIAAIAGLEEGRYTNGIAVALVVAITVELVRGLVRLLRIRGVTAEAVTGGLAIYLLIGLFFACLIGVVDSFASQPYFADGRGMDMGERVYFSFTTLTTTGFGDPVAATRIGKSLAVTEMLIGQIYLVTVISLLVSRAGFGRRPSSA